MSSDSAEAGVFQTSYDSRSASPELPKIFARFRTSNVGCNLSVWKSSVTCSESNWKNWGDANTAGFEFQKRQKECPALATEYAAVMIRVNRRHYGPVNTKKVEIKSECNSMLANVEQYVVNNPSVCEAL